MEQVDQMFCKAKFHPKLIKRLSLSFLLYLALNSALAAGNSEPQVGIVIPSSGASTPDQQINFTTTFVDPDGWQDIAGAHFLIGTSVNEEKCFHTYYNREANKLYLKDNRDDRRWLRGYPLRDDREEGWLGGYPPGSLYRIIQGPSARLDCSKTTVTGLDNTLTINWAVAFRPSFIGKKNIYLRVRDKSGVCTEWIQKGTWAIIPTNYPPTAETVTPSLANSSHNQEIIFASTCSDPDGWQDISIVYLLFNNSMTSTESVYGYYLPLTNKLYFYDHSQRKWLGGFPLGSDNIIETPLAKLNYKNTTVSGNGSDLTIKWAITFKPSFTGTKNIYLLIRDKAGAQSGWRKKATVILPNNLPQVLTLTPSSGSSYSNQPITFTTTYSDPDSWQNIEGVYLLINTSTNGRNCLYVYYNQNTNRLYIRNNNNFFWSGGSAPGSNRIIENSYASLDCCKTTISNSANTLTVNWSVSFKPSFVGEKNIYLCVKDDANATSGWIEKGTWTVIPDNTPPTGTIKINNDSLYTNSTLVTLSLSSQDNEEGSGVDKMQFSNDNLTWSAPEDYKTTKTWELTSVDGQKTVYVKFSDKSGNWSEPVSDTIILDTTLPQIKNITPQDGSTFYEDGTILISVVVNDIDPSPLEYQFSIDGIIKQTWSDKSDYSWSTTETDKGSHNINIEVRDIGGGDTKQIEIYILRKPIEPSN